MSVAFSVAATTVRLASARKVLQQVSQRQRPRFSHAMSASAASSRQQSRVALGADLFVEVVPILRDNFCYLLGDSTSRAAVAVDPAEPDVVLSALRSAGLSLSAVLVTHHHWDHAGGNAAIRAKFPNLPIYALENDIARIPGASKRLRDGETAQLPDTAFSARALFTPCHTLGHACYVVDAPGARTAVFTGDTLFVAGCGKFFEGDARMMQKSLNETLAALPDDTLVFCGHEYTVSNLRFAASIEPHNDALNAKVAWAKERVAHGLPTVPSTIGEEKSYNPFMRTSVPQVAEAVQCKGKPPAAVMGALRTAKNNF